jgi:hypothetical protein
MNDDEPIKAMVREEKRQRYCAIALLRYSEFSVD